jgi:hypothetical protein
MGMPRVTDISIALTANLAIFFGCASQFGFTERQRVRSPVPRSLRGVGHLLSQRRIGLSSPSPYRPGVIRIYVIIVIVSAASVKRRSSAIGKPVTFLFGTFSPVGMITWVTQKQCECNPCRQKKCPLLKSYALKRLPISRRPALHTSLRKRFGT